MQTLEKLTVELCRFLLYLICSRDDMFLKKEMINGEMVEEKTYPEHESVVKSYGSLYLQYENEFWWWELIVMVSTLVCCS